MSVKFSSLCTCAFMFVFFSFLAVHYAHMKTPSLDRSFASHTVVEKPLYDASWKL